MNGALLRRMSARLATVIVAMVFALVSTTGVALAQNSKDKTEARRLYKKASVAYNLGKFDEAITLFEQAYEAYPFPNFLFNIGQSYRQKGDCKNAIYFYKRFLSLAKNVKPNVKADVEGRIKDLRENCRTTEEIKERPPDRTMPPDKPTPKPPTGDDDDDRVATGDDDDATGDDDDSDDGDDDTEVAVTDDDDDGDDDDDDVVTPGITRPATPRDSLLTSAVSIGPSFLSMGDLETSGAQFSLGVGVGYPLQLGGLGITVGAMATYTPVPWDNGAGLTGTSSLASFLVNTGLRIGIMDKLSVRSEIGLGVQLLSGLSEGNIFVPPGTMATGSLSMINVRASAGVEYELTSNVAVIADPVVFSYSPGRDDLREEITAFQRFELMAGVIYRL